MTRKNVLIDLDDRLHQALTGLSIAKKGGNKWVQQWRNRNPQHPIPAMIPTADRRGSVPITPKGYDGLNAWIRMLFDSDAKLKRILTFDEWRSFVISSILRFVQATSDHFENTNERVRLKQAPGLFERHLRKQLKTAAINLHGATIVHFFPAVFAGEPLTKSLKLGPVTFVPPHRIGTEINRLYRSRSKLALRARDEAVKNMSEWTGRVTCFIRVEVSGLGGDRSKQWARAAARLSLTAILLPLGSQAVKDASLLDEAGKLRARRGMSFRTDKITLPGFSMEWPKLRRGNVIVRNGGAKYSQYKKALANMLSLYVNTDSSSSGPWKCKRLSDLWLSAMHWFQRGMTAELDFEAIVYFGTTLDVLAGGGKNAGILNVVTTIYGAQPGDVLFQGQHAVTIKQFVDQLYDDGRSRLSHGTREGLRGDFTLLRNRAQSCVCSVIHGYGLNLMSYEKMHKDDDLQAFLNTSFR
jgi:hypothetical protein